MFADGCKSGAINFRNTHIGIDQRLGHMRPNGFGALTMAAPWRIEHHKPLALMPYIDETVAQL